jgi:hypothetical protein
MSQYRVAYAGSDNTIRRLIRLPMELGRRRVEAERLKPRLLPHTGRFILCGSFVAARFMN